jgi:hypothetical protein
LILNILTFLDLKTLTKFCKYFTSIDLLQIFFSSDTHTHTHTYTKPTDPIFRNVVFKDDISEHFILCELLQPFPNSRHVKILPRTSYRRKKGRIGHGLPLNKLNQ